ncbi:MAG: GldG family protein [Oscillospiraceae bacterium]|nr:GldG family protein [Oscillospiraceae bacterium]
MKRTHSGTSFRDSFRTRSSKVGSYSILATVFVLVIAVIVNLIAAKLPSQFTQYDVSAQDLYTLSEQSRDMVTGLSEDITIYWNVQTGNENESLRRLLDRYQALSKHLIVKEVDPVINPTFSTQYTAEKITNNSLIVVSGARSKYVDYSDIFLVDYSSYYTTGAYTEEFDGENAITGALDYVTSDSLPVAYQLTGHGETALDSTIASQIASQNIEVETLSILQNGGIPADCSSLFIVAPQSDLSDSEAALILDYLQKGGHLFLFTSFVYNEHPNLDAILFYYGVQEIPGMVVEGDSSRCVSGYQHYILPTLGSHEITQPLISGNYLALTAFTSGIQTLDNLRDGVTVTDLLTSSDASYSKTAGINLETFDKEADDQSGPFSLGVAVSEEVENGTTRIVWYPSQYLLDSNCNNAVSGGNYDLILNSIGWLCEHESAISIHSKNMVEDTLTVTNAQFGILALILIVLIPLMLLAVGIVITVKRRRK